VDVKNSLIFDHLHVPLWCQKNKIDILFSPKNVIPFFSRSKNIVTIHDLAYFMPESNAYLPHDAIYMKSMIKNSCKRADVIIADSRNTKKDIVRFTGTDADKIKVVHLGVNGNFKVIKEKKLLDKVRSEYQLSDRFILFTGGITPRKNLLKLIQAFNEISDEIPHELVLTGSRGWNNKKELELIEQNNKIKRLGFLPDEDMPVLYNLADAFVYPSLYEGFGLPILESMACGCPVISSDSSSLPEVVGDAGLMVDPYDVDALAKAIVEVLTNDRCREELVQKGLDRVKQFTWENSIKNTLNALTEISIGA
jgi:glycosyltransferase involved in cell wall biosynthesis